MTCQIAYSFLLSCGVNTFSVLKKIITKELGLIASTLPVSFIFLLIFNVFSSQYLHEKY